SFLHNLATNDIKNLPSGAGCELFLTNLKARVLGHGIAMIRGDDVLLEVEPGRTDAILKHLDRHLISERVELTDRSKDVVRVTFLGPRAAETAAKLSGIDVGTIEALPTWHRVEKDGTMVRRQGFVTPPGFDVLLPQRIAVPGPASPETWETLRIEAGWPRWGHEIDENRFVVETGRIAQAICYTKGCYLGQEPIVMARDRGQVNRRLVGLVADGPLPVGSRIMQGEIEAVRVTSSALSPRLRKTVALAYAYRGHQEPGSALTFDGTIATIVPLPIA
ncbi:MAG TPA: glycine cleavage T C-terminal barrel domain-containing protein, partial [Gemmataceae bacterium]|nr:glycine cleavage T C-terminal barrel domain-containing protein [Gemmataceae bacterium]